MTETSTKPKKPYEQIDKWIDAVVVKTQDKLHERLKSARAMPRPISVDDPPNAIEKDQQKTYNNIQARYDVLEKILAEPAPENPKKKRNIDRIMRGLMVEFINQTERGIQPLNIEQDREPEARNYWRNHQERFAVEAKPGVVHVAASFKKIRESLPKNAKGSPPWEALAEIVRMSTLTFKEEYPKLKTDKAPVASVYNDHMQVINRSLFGKDIPVAPDWSR